METDNEIQALQRIAAKQQVHALRRRALRRAWKLRHAPETRLRFPAQSKSLSRLHAEDAERGVVDEDYVLPRRGFIRRRAAL